MLSFGRSSLEQEMGDVLYLSIFGSGVRVS